MLFWTAFLYSSKLPSASAPMGRHCHGREACARAYRQAAAWRVCWRRAHFVSNITIFGLAHCRWPVIGFELAQLPLRHPARVVAEVAGSRPRALSRGTRPENRADVTNLKNQHMHAPSPDTSRRGLAFGSSAAGPGGCPRETRDATCSPRCRRCLRSCCCDATSA